VAKELFQRAREAGADEILTRGALDHHLEEVLLNLAGRARGHHAQSIGPVRRSPGPAPLPQDHHRPML
jgi:hypothetical protein